MAQQQPAFTDEAGLSRRPGRHHPGASANPPFKVKIINHDHPITKGVSDFVVTDEQHFLIYEKDPKDVLAMSVQEEELTYPAGKDRKPSNTCEGVCAYEYGKGLVCFFAPGHAITALWNPEYEKMQKNAVKWLLHQT